jgi:hypothetical protein
MSLLPTNKSKRLLPFFGIVNAILKTVTLNYPLLMDRIVCQMKSVQSFIQNELCSNSEIRIIYGI